MMFDRFNREVNYLRISITDRCNLRCIYCLPKEGIALHRYQDILRYEEILRVVSVAVGMGLVKVRVTGGEPLVRRGCVEFLAELKKIEGLRDISMTTNGIFLEEFAQKIYAAGIDRINISLDSLDKDKYSCITNGGNLEAVLRGIARAEEVGFSPIKINTVAIRGLNEDEILQFVQLAVDRPYQVRFIELMPMGQSRLGGGLDYISAEELIDKISEHYALERIDKKEKSDGPAKIYTIKGGRGEIGFIHPISNHFCSGCNRLRLTSDGKLRVCLLRDTEIDLKKALRENCRDTDLEKIIADAIASKPKEHNLVCTENGPKKCRAMSAIGG
jgi:cyclic pyranopterin phosphate synthase